MARWIRQGIVWTVGIAALLGVLAWTYEPPKVTLRVTFEGREATITITPDVPARISKDGKEVIKIELVKVQE